MGLSFLFCCCMCYSWRSGYFTIIWGAGCIKTRLQLPSVAQNWLFFFGEVNISQLLILRGRMCQNSFTVAFCGSKMTFLRLSNNKLLWFKPLQFSQDQIAQGSSSDGIPSPLLTVTMRHYLLCFNPLTWSNTRIGKSQSLLSTATNLYSLTLWKTSTNACKNIFT